MENFIMNKKRTMTVNSATKAEKVYDLPSLPRNGGMTEQERYLRFLGIVLNESYPDAVKRATSISRQKAVA